MRRFGGGGTVDEEAARYHDRFISTRPEDRPFDNRAYHDAATEYPGKLPDDQFHDAARNAVAQVPSQEKAGVAARLTRRIKWQPRKRWREHRCGQSRQNRQYAWASFN